MRPQRTGWLAVLILILGLGVALGLRAFIRSRVETAPPPPGASCIVVRMVSTGLSVDGAFLLPLEDIDMNAAVIAPLHAELAARGKRCLLIEADTSVKYVIVVYVMHTARAAGIVDIDIRDL